jgi:glyoxylase-like metal-dependent hydrolase (beta-lactamase superfamily II)
MITHRYDHGIHAIDAEYLMPLFDAVHLVVDEGRAAFIDCGTAHSVPAMLAALDELDVKREDVDWLLLTHVHLDHAGGAGQLMQALPNAKAIVHPRGAPHMADPRKLIEASIAVYGRELYDRLYGELLPIEQSRVVSTTEGQRFALGGREFEIIHTPGHALHHQTFFDHGSQSVFTGDTLGLSYRVFDVEGRAFGVPTTSPSQFDPSQLIDSIRRILACRPKAAFLTHYARIEDLERIGADLIRMIEAHVATALSHEGEPAESARSAIRAALKEIFVRELRQFGSAANDDTIEHWLGGDLDLNTDGLLAWLARRNRG